MKHCRGFTLIETVLAIAVMGMTMGAIVSLSLALATIHNKSVAAEEVMSNAQIATEIMSARIREATGVNTSASVFGSDPGTLSLAYTDASRNPTVFRLSADNGVLLMTEGLSVPIAVTSTDIQVTNLVFTNLSDGARENIRIQLTTQTPSAVTDATASFTTTLQTAVSVRQ